MKTSHSTQRCWFQSVCWQVRLSKQLGSRFKGVQVVSCANVWHDTPSTVILSNDSKQDSSKYLKSILVNSKAKVELFEHFDQSLQLKSMVAVEEGMFAIGSPIQTVRGPLIHAVNETSCLENDER